MVLQGGTQVRLQRKRASTSTPTMEDNNNAKRKNPRREAAEAIDELRGTMEEILGTPSYEDQHIDAKRHAAHALDGLDNAEEALRLWRDAEEEAVESLDQDVADALEELRDAASDELREASIGELLAAAGRTRGDGREPISAPSETVGKNGDIDRQDGKNGLVNVKVSVDVTDGG